VLVEGPDKTGKRFTGRTRGNRVCVFEASPRLIGQSCRENRAGEVSTLYGELALSVVSDARSLLFPLSHNLSLFCMPANSTTNA